MSIVSSQAYVQPGLYTEIDTHAIYIIFFLSFDNAKMYYHWFYRVTLDARVTYIPVVWL